MRIKLRKPTGTNQLEPAVKAFPTPRSWVLYSVLTTVSTAEEREMVATLLQRYGAKRVADLLPEHVTPFTTELQNVLRGKAPHPADSILNPTMMEVSK